MSNQHNSNLPLEYSKESEQNTIVGFWIFLTAEIALFATLFATYAVLYGRTADDLTPGELFEPGIVMTMTFILLTSSFTMGLAIFFMRQGNQKQLVIWTLLTLLLGLTFISFEIYEFIHYIHEGVSIQSSAYWSAFFTLTGTHGIHVLLGIGWMILILIQLKQHGITAVTSRKIFVVGLYWHFLDVIWIFIFTGVYLTGMVI